MICTVKSTGIKFEPIIREHRFKNLILRSFSAKDYNGDRKKLTNPKEEYETLYLRDKNKVETIKVYLDDTFGVNGCCYRFVEVK